MNVNVVIAILEEIASREPTGVSELSRRLSISKSTVQRCLVALNEAGWLEEDLDAGKRRWRIGARARTLAAAAPAPDIRDVGQPAMQRLARETRENVYLTARDGYRMVRVDIIESPAPVRVVHKIGERVPLHASSSGKAVLATVSPAQLATLLPSTLTRYTKSTVSSKRALAAELATIRIRGYACNMGEYREDVSTVSAPVLDASGEALGALSISVATYSADRARLDELGKRVLAAANQVSMRRWPGSFTLATTAGR